MNIEQARFNMVEQQIRTWEVLDQNVLDLLYVVRREDFVPPAYRALAFSDLEIPLNPRWKHGYCRCLACANPTACLKSERGQGT
jgi:protein-L-isoaspartate(D-aspartate) O-methyltransferase